MATYTVKCYKETGLLTGNSLDSIDKLETLGFSSASYEGVWLLQDRSLSRIKIAASYESVKTVDYCRIGDAAYWVEKVIMLNENVAELTLLPDFITTVGIANMTVISGWCKRRCVTDDTIFKNEIDEPFNPEEPLLLENLGLVRPSSDADQDYHVVLSSVNLLKIDEVAKTYVDETNDVKVAVPQVPPIYEETSTMFSIDGVTMGGEVGITEYHYPNATAFNTDTLPVRDGIRAARSLGVESCILDSYTLPSRYIYEGRSDAEHYDKLVGVNKVFEDGHPPLYKQVRNKKVLSGQFMKYVLTSIVSGDFETYRVEDIIEPTLAEKEIRWRIMANLTPTGRPIAAPNFFRGRINNLMQGAVRGEQWQKNPITYTSASGQLVQDIAYERMLKAAILRESVGVFTGATGNIQALSSANQAYYNAYTPNERGYYNQQKIESANIGLVSSIANMAVAPFNVAASMMDIRSSQIAHETQRRIRPPEIKFPRLDSFSNYVGNYFYELRYRLSNNDMERFDDFLTAYGYAVDEPFTIDCLLGRKHFNFVQANDVNISIPFSKFYKDGVINQLAGGVRIWHTRPTYGALKDNPITGGSENVV